jgi:hypothetical protein
MKRPLIAFASVALTLALSGAAQAQQAITPDQLVGVWRLQSQVVHDASNGKDTVGPLSIRYLAFAQQEKNLRTLVNFSELSGNKLARMLLTLRPLSCLTRMLHTLEL